MLMVAAGCANVQVERPDGTSVKVSTIGTTNVGDFEYERTETGISLKFGKASVTPEGIPEVIGSVGDAGAVILTGGAVNLLRN